MNKISRVEIHEFTHIANNLGLLTNANTIGAVGYAKGQSIKLDKVNLGGDVNPVLRSLSRLPPVIVSTVKAKTSNLAALTLSSMLSVTPLS